MLDRCVKNDDDPSSYEENEISIESTNKNKKKIVERIHCKKLDI